MHNKFNLTILQFSCVIPFTARELKNKYNYVHLGWLDTREGLGTVKLGKEW